VASGVVVWRFAWLCEGELRVVGAVVGGGGALRWVSYEEAR